MCRSKELSLSALSHISSICCGTSEGKEHKCTSCPTDSDIGLHRNVRLQAGSSLNGQPTNSLVLTTSTLDGSRKSVPRKQLSSSTRGSDHLDDVCCNLDSEIIDQYFNYINDKENGTKPNTINADPSSILSTRIAKETRETRDDSTRFVLYTTSRKTGSHRSSASKPPACLLKVEEVLKQADVECAVCNQMYQKGFHSHLRSAESINEPRSKFEKSRASTKVSDASPKSQSRIPKSSLSPAIEQRVLSITSGSARQSALVESDNENNEQDDSQDVPNKASHLLTDEERITIMSQLRIPHYSLSPAMERRILATIADSVTRKALDESENEKNEQDHEQNELNEAPCHPSTHEKQSIVRVLDKASPSYENAPKSVQADLGANVCGQGTPNFDCRDCCQDKYCKARDLLNLLRSNPDSFIDRYRISQGLKPVGSKEDHFDPSKEYVPLLSKTHGDVMLGDPKYHYLMVDGSTSMTGFNKRHVSVPKHVVMKVESPDISISKRKSSELESDPDPSVRYLQDSIKEYISKTGAEQEKKHENEQNVEQNDDEHEQNVEENRQGDIDKEKTSDHELPKQDERTEQNPASESPDKEPKIEKERSNEESSEIPSHDSDTSEGMSTPQTRGTLDNESAKLEQPMMRGTEEKEPKNEEDKHGETAKEEEEHKTSDDGTNLIDLQMDDYQATGGRRVSISWTSDVHPNEAEDRPQLNTRRASQVSWKYSDSDLPKVHKKEEPYTRKSTKGSLLDQILREEKLRKTSRLSQDSDGSKEKDKRLSILVSTQTESKKKKCTLFKRKPKNSKSSSKTRHSKDTKSTRTLRTMQKLDSDSSDSDDFSGESENEDGGSRRSSQDSYQKRKISIGNPVSEKDKAISKYLSNIQ